MLGHRGVPQVQEFGKLADRSLAWSAACSITSLFIFILAYIRNYVYNVKPLHNSRT